MLYSEASLVITEQLNENFFLRFSPSTVFFSLAQCLITLHWWNSQENPTAAGEQEQIVVPQFVWARTSYHNTAEEIQSVGTHGMRGYMVGKNIVDKLNMHHPLW